MRAPGPDGGDGVRIKRTFAALEVGDSAQADEAVDGVDAVAKIRARTYGLISMDNQMPVLNGLDAIDQARASGYAGIMLLVSGDAFEPAARERILARGVDAILTKMQSPSILDVLDRLAALKAAAAA